MGPILKYIIDYFCTCMWYICRFDNELVYSLACSPLSRDLWNLIHRYMFTISKGYYANEKWFKKKTRYKCEIPLHTKLDWITLAYNLLNVFFLCILVESCYNTTLHYQSSYWILRILLCALNIQLRTRWRDLYVTSSSSNRGNYYRVRS